jgi:sulfate/thiosulfate transport system ATP-binding protein
VVMNHGRIEQIGSPEEVYEKPANAFVYSFLGKVNEFKGESLVTNLPHVKGTEEAVGYIRPHEIVLHHLSKENSIPAVVIHINKAGSTVRIELKRLDTDELFKAEMTVDQYRKQGPFHKGEVLYAEFKNIVLFDRETHPIQAEKNVQGEVVSAVSSYM